MQLAGITLGSGIVVMIFLAAAQTRHLQDGQPILQRIPENARLTRLLGMRIENHDGQDLGKLRDLVLDMQTGQARFAIISSGGFLGFGRHVKLVPVQSVSTATAKRGTLAFDVNLHRGTNVPSFRKTESTDGLQLASTLVGKGVINRLDEEVGELSDLLVDLSGRKPILALVSADRLLKTNEAFALPFNRLSLSRDKLLLDAKREMFYLARPLTETAWQQAAGSGGGIDYR